MQKRDSGSSGAHIWFEPYQIHDVRVYGLAYSHGSVSVSYPDTAYRLATAPVAAPTAASASTLPVFVVVAVALVAVVGLPILAMLLADNAQRQRLANAMYAKSTIVSHKVEVSDPAFESMVEIIAEYHWRIEEEAEESPVLEALRKSGSVASKERFSSLWDYLAYFDPIEMDEANRVFVDWLSLDEPHLANDFYEERFDDALKHSSQVRLRKLGYADHRIGGAGEEDGYAEEYSYDEYNVERINHYQFFNNVDSQILGPSDVYMNNGRVLDAQRLITIAANRLRLLQIDSSGAFKAEANQIFVLEMLFADKTAVVGGQAELRKIYRAIRAMDWQDSNYSPWLDSDGRTIEKLPVFELASNDFRCQINYLRAARSVRTGAPAQLPFILEAVRSLQTSRDCRGLELMVEWLKFLELRIEASQVFAVSCVTQPETDGAKCGDGVEETEQLQTRKQLFAILARNTRFRINKNLNDDVSRLAGIVQTARKRVTIE
ncbi:MAG: hypothetical protein R3D45_06710 [Rhizobiaceae bacterium]